MSCVGAHLRLHSAYNPVKEARRYVDETVTMLEPRFITVTEPGESWLAEALRARYPRAFLIALRYSTDLFLDSDSMWDAVWRPDSAVGIHTFLFTLIPEESLPFCVFLPWKPSDTAWPDMANGVWNEISAMIHTQMSVIRTRHHFGPVWLSNSVRNAILVKHQAAAVCTHKPVILAAAGPSLENLFPLTFRERYYVIAVSSALKCVLGNGISPDLCITTDGGYWSKGHLHGIPEGIPVAFPLEAAVPPDILKKNPSIILDYGSEFESVLTGIAEIKAERARQCATVSGTASYYGLEHTTNRVYAAGLDLSLTNSFTHCRPHSTDSSTLAGTDRFKPLSGLLHEQGRENRQMEIYARWFASRDKAFTDRFIRLLPVPGNLGTIRSVGIEDIPPETGSTPASLVCDRPPANPSTRDCADRVSSWLFEISGRFASTGTGEAEFCNDALMCQLLQMISFGDYLSYMKGERDADLLYTNAASFLSRLANKAQRYESAGI